MSTESAPSASFSARLEGELARAGVAPLALARELGISRSAMRGWLVGDGLPSGRLLVRLADRLGVTTDWLLGRERP